MVKTLDEIIASLKSKFGDDTTDDVITILEDVSDTIGDLSSRLTDSGDWKQKFEENDANWRKKYIERFSGLTEKEEDETKIDVIEEDEDENLSYDSLFKANS